VVEKSGYISAVSGEAYAGKKPSGKVTVAGSSSVTPVMEKLKEAYIKLNPNAVIEINQSDSTTGVNSALDGICDIGMASRALKDSEIEKGVKPTVIAIDGIAVIVNNDNPTVGMKAEEVTKIYIGEITKWSEIGN
ncbi:MAG TPA: substrate-binding domain-containing protein, partial [Clostridia bacterium]|nr:substrate-binding domain-containing protein [Clostridia bacterium]